MKMAKILLEIDTNLTNIQSSIGDENIFAIADDREKLFKSISLFEDYKKNKKKIDILYCTKIEELLPEAFFWLKEAEEELRSKIKQV